MLSSESEVGSSIRCRLAGFGRAGCRVVVVPLFSHGSVLAMVVDTILLERWSKKRTEMGLKDEVTRAHGSKQALIDKHQTKLRCSK